MELKETIDMMQSTNYKERFVAEYRQTKIRYERLKTFNTRIEAAEATNTPPPKHDCPLELLKAQQSIMGQYLHILEVRSVIEGVELN